MAITGRAWAGACCSMACSSSCSAPAPSLSSGVEAGAFVNPIEPGGGTLHPGLLRAHRLSRPRYADAWSRNTYGLTITTVVVKPKSRGIVQAAVRQSRRHAAGVAQSAEGPGRHAHDDRGAAILPQGLPHGPACEAASGKIAIPDPQQDTSDEALARPLQALRQDQLPSERHLPHGAAGRPAWRCWIRACGCGHRRLARLRSLRHAEHQCAATPMHRP